MMTFLHLKTFLFCSLCAMELVPLPCCRECGVLNYILTQVESPRLTLTCVLELANTCAKSPAHQDFFCVSGSNAFAIDLWGKESDPFLHATQFCAHCAGIASVQLTKMFLAERGSQQDTTWHRINFTMEEKELNYFDERNTTDSQKQFQSDVENVFFIAGVLSVVGSMMQFLSWFHSGCKLSHWPQAIEREATSPSVQSQNICRCTQCNLLLALFLLCLITCLGVTNEESFTSFGITFAVNILDWTESDATNLVTVFFVSELMSLCMSIVLAKFVDAHKLLGFSILTSFGGALIMMLTLKVASFSLWMG